METWLSERFPQGELLYDDTGGLDFHRWTVSFGPGEPALRVGATKRVVNTERLLEERLSDLERGWLHDLEEGSEWIFLMAAGVVKKSEDSW